VVVFVNSSRCELQAACDCIANVLYLIAQCAAACAVVGCVSAQGVLNVHVAATAEDC
jgi:hypothetical protein